MKQESKSSVIVPAPSFGIRTIAAPPAIQPDSSNSPEQTIDDPSFANCEQHSVVVKPSTTPKTVHILGESSFARESKLSPGPYLPPRESPSPSSTFLQPIEISLPPHLPEKEIESTPKPFLETYHKPSATILSNENVLPPFQSRNSQSTTISPRRPSPKPERPQIEGQEGSAPESVIATDNEVDSCKHSFHSFLCTPSSFSRSRRPFNNLGQPPSSPLTGESSFGRPSKLLPPVARPSSQETKISVAEKTVPITERSRTTLTPALKSIAPLTDPNIYAEAAQNPIQLLSLQDQKQPDICKDAFHSFLCQPINSSRRRQKYGERYQSSNKLTRDPSVPLRADSSFNQPSKLLPILNQPLTTLAPSTSFSPHFTPETDSLYQKPAISCNHTKPPQTTNTPFVIVSSTTPPILAPKPESTFIQAARLPFPKTQFSTLRTSEPQTFVRNDPAAQTPDVTVLRPNHDVNHDHSHAHDHGHNHHRIDICKDPFHSFLCTPVIPSKRRRPTGELPARFRNAADRNILEAGSFNQPTKVIPPDTKSVTIIPPSIITKSSFPSNVPTYSPQENDHRLQSSKNSRVRLPPQPATQIRSQNDDPCNRIFNTFLFEKNGSIRNLSSAEALSLPRSNLEGASSFDNPSKVLPSLTLNPQGTEYKNSNQGYEYNPPPNVLQDPSHSLRGESTIGQTSKIVVPVSSTGKNNENLSFASRFKEFPGYSYQEPSKTFQYPISTLPSTTTRVTTEGTSGQGTGNHEISQGYNYPKPPPDQQILPSGYNYPIPAQSFQYPESLRESSSIESRKTLPSVYFNGQNTKEGAYQTRNPEDAYTTTAELDIRPRSFEKTDQNCDHSLPRRAYVDTQGSSAPSSPSEFVRGLSGTASVLAASNELPDKCNHPFLGYVCKRSSDVKTHK